MMFKDQIFATVATIGFIIAVVCGLLTWVELPVFDPITLAWISFAGLISAAIATAALILPNIWSN